MSVTINASTSSGLVQTADTSGTVEIQSNGSTKLTVSSTGAYGQLVSGTAQASTSGTVIDFTGIPSWAKRITVMLSGVSTNGTSSLIIQIGDSGGIEGSGYISTAGAISSTSANATNQTAAFLIAATASAANTATGHAVLTKIDGNTWVCSAVTRSGTLLCTYAAGDKTLSDVLTQLRVTSVSSDTFDAGTINILYEG